MSIKHSAIKMTNLLFVSLFAFSSILHAQQFNVLLFTKTMAWHHKSKPAGVKAIKELAKKHDFSLTWHEDAAYINDAFLQNFDAIIFLVTSGNVLDEMQKQALKSFIQSGKGFVGIHSASDTEKKWPWFQQLVGRTFNIHPVVQTARLNVVNTLFPGMSQIPQSLLWTDEWYDFGPENTKNLNYLLSVDEVTYDTHSDWGNNKTGNGMGSFHPIAWYQEFDGGRSFYTALGHLDAVYENSAFLDHLYGGIYWSATGKGIQNPPNN